MKKIQILSALVAMIFLVACNKGVDPKLVESMKTENSEWQAKLADMQAANAALSAEYGTLKSNLMSSLGEKGAAKMMATDSAEIATKDGEVNGVVTSHTDLVNGFSAFLAENDTWLNELASKKVSTEEAQKSWEEKKAKGAEFVTKNEEIVKTWADWKASFDTWAAEKVTKYSKTK